VKTLKLASALLAASVLVISLSGCGSSIDHGTVTAKVHEPASVIITQSCHLVGKVMVCTPIPIVDDEDWRLDLKSGDEKGSVYVTEGTFAEYEVGEVYP
jgi:uncharacterized lipoprotein YehR (DUF1307 family)